MWIRIVTLGLLVIIVMDTICSIEALNQNGEGVCVVNKSSRQRRKKTFSAVINKWCGHRKCIVRKYKYETYLTWTNHTVCCNGWLYDNKLDICSPICSIECYGGKCVGPDQCQCQEPTYLGSNNTCITPTCNPTCVNADCYQNNTCVCKPNYSRYNSTYCFQCKDGYTADENLKCVPECNPPCINSSCNAPNTCNCNPGFYFKNSSVCEPKRNCISGKWGAPNNCTCDEGYILLNETICIPKCDSCSNGDCVAPNNCSCHRGYVYVGGICRPICSVPCVNGFCSAPEVCTCNDGYVKNGAWHCVKKRSCAANCKGFCDGDACVPWDCRKPIDNACGDDLRIQCVTTP